MKDGDQKTRLAVIIIHGWGGAYAQALDGIERLLRFPARYENGVFHLGRRDGMVVRRLLGVDDPDPVIRSFQKLAVARLLAACFEPGKIDDFETATIREAQLQRNFARFGLPTGAAVRHRRATQLEVEALAELEPVMPVIRGLQELVAGDDDGMPLETTVRERAAAQNATGLDPVATLELLRSLHETGGDVDTVMSAAFYTYWLRYLAAKRQQPFRRGIEYRYAFMNYHEPFMHLAEFAPCDLYVADLPIGALPDFEAQVRKLRDQDVRLIRYEDHHPYTPEQGAMLQRLKDDGLLEFLDMSGPVEDDELEPEELFCAADMVHRNCIAGTDLDSPALQHLRAISHAEDFVTDRQPLGILLTTLIKGGICKIELAQLLAADPDEAAIRDKIVALGWEERMAEWEAVFQETAPQLDKGMVEILVKRPQTSLAEAGGAALGPGSDVPVRGDPDKDALTILVAHAPPPPKGARIPVGRVVEFIVAKRPDVDYLFYCYGSSLMVCRRLNHADLSINLGALMPQLGGESDGGHAGAAVCRPCDNPAYPARLGRVNADSFGQFCDYLAHHLKVLGLEVIAVRDKSQPGHRDSLAKSSKKLLYVTVAAIVLGLLLLLIPSWRPAAALESNADFLPQLATPAADDLADDDGGGEEAP